MTPSTPAPSCCEPRSKALCSTVTTTTTTTIQDRIRASLQPRRESACARRSRTKERSNTQLEGGPCWLWRTPSSSLCTEPSPRRLGPSPSPLPLGTFCSYVPTSGSPCWDLEFVGPISAQETVENVWEHVIFFDPNLGSVCVPCHNANVLYYALHPSLMGTYHLHAPSHSFPILKPDLVGPISFRGTTGNSMFSLILTIEETVFPIFPVLRTHSKWPSRLGTAGEHMVFPSLRAWPLALSSNLRTQVPSCDHFSRSLGASTL